MVFNFPKLVKQLLSGYSDCDYSVLNTRVFISCWLTFSLDASVTTMRGLFRKLNIGGRSIDQSTFSKANQHRSSQPFEDLYKSLNRLVKQKNKPSKDWDICPIDSTTITLTSKVLWALGYHQVKLFNAISQNQGSTESCVINFGSDHDYKFAVPVTEPLTEKQVGVMDRGFAGLPYFAELKRKNKPFVIRLSLNYKKVPLESGEWQVGTGKDSGVYRVVWFSDLESKVTYCLLTNLPFTVSNEEVSDIYRLRWQIELFWKFLKMHLKLDQLITKNVNGIRIQLYACLCAYLILQLLEIPKIWGSSLLDKLRFFQASMTQEYSLVHWIDRILSDRPIRLYVGDSDLVM
jgi:putative transposase